MLLSPSPRRAHLRGFWVSLCIAGAVVGGVPIWWLVSPGAAGATLVAMAALAIPGYVRPEIASSVYRAWNALAHLYVRAANLLLRGLCFFVILVAVGRAGSSLALARPTSASSLWVSRGTGSATVHRYGHRLRNGRPDRPGWVRTYLAWFADSPNRWAICLLPLLLLLRAFKRERGEVEVATHNYTLY
jgi:hypothetical protein